MHIIQIATTIIVIFNSKSFDAYKLIDKNIGKNKIEIDKSILSFLFIK